MQCIEVHGIVEWIIDREGIIPGQFRDEVGADVGHDAAGDYGNEGDVQKSVEWDCVVFGEDCENVDS